MHRSQFLRVASWTLIGAATPAGAVLGMVARADDDPLVDTVAGGRGRINYAAGVVKATGRGAPPASAESPAQARLMAGGAARADALRNLAMAVSSVQVTADTTVKNYVLKDDTVRTKVSALLQSPRIVSESFERDGTAVVVMELPLYGGETSVAAVVLPEVVERDRERAEAPEPAPAPRGPIAARPRTAPRPKPAPRPAAGLATTPADDDGPFTSVIVDCRGLDIQAVMSPKLYDTTGREIYGTMEIDVDYAIEVGIVGYPRNVREALSGQRAGERPLIVRAVDVKDRFRIDPVVSVGDGDRILAAGKRDGFLEKCRVIFLCDPVRRG